MGMKTKGNIQLYSKAGHQIRLQKKPHGDAVLKHVYI
ncbi:hypothetical protein BATR1942_08550 [Bacillus atrophaeus 1942]|jgi:hypothetical protein|uniref:Uncharacterized protein n=1 Tax=Bacillus atrophaeus (strain 1942) TaxID=720555 RepID=A0ABM5LXJ2_BACA1|nr:hypothetical protein BATR1942_08550 [Bacillus atrophaeus 1942]EIM11899.1 hypothetical protein UY9_04822 [Bacillus atrophaeus C89]